MIMINAAAAINAAAIKGFASVVCPGVSVTGAGPDVAAVEYTP